MHIQGKAGASSYYVCTSAPRIRSELVRGYGSEGGVLARDRRCEADREAVAWVVATGDTRSRSSRKSSLNDRDPDVAYAGELAVHAQKLAESVAVRAKPKAAAAAAMNKTRMLKLAYRRRHLRRLGALTSVRACAVCGFGTRCARTPHPGARNSSPRAPSRIR